jgi:hypothetical protein
MMILLGGGIAVLALTGKKKENAATAAMLTSNAAINAAAAAVPSGQSAAAATKEAKAQVDDIFHSVAPHGVKGIGKIYKRDGVGRRFRVGAAAAAAPKTPPLKLALSEKYGPFSPKNPPSPKQFAIMYSISPTIAASTIPAGTASSYAAAIKADAGLLTLAKETDAQRRIYNMVSLLSPNDQRIFASNCSFRSLDLLDLGPMKGTGAKKLGSEIVSASIARAEGKMTAAQLEAIAKPRIKALQEIATKKGAPAFASSTIQALEATALSAPATYTAEARKIVQYSNMMQAIRMNRQAAVQFDREVSSMMARAEAAAPAAGRGAAKATEGSARAAEGAARAEEQSARKAAQEADADILQRLLRKAL